MKKILMMMALSLCCSYLTATNEDTLTLGDVGSLQKNDSLIRNFKYLTGKVKIGKNLATVDVPPGCLFLETADARTLLEDIYGNVPNPNCLGILLSDTPNVLTGCTWLVDYNYNGDGHVDDDDAKDIDYEDLLKDIKEQTNEGNAERVKLGYESVTMIGWAKKPFYDEVNKKLHWAKELEFSGVQSHVLNYNIRVLGREGFLEMNIISNMEDLAAVDKDVDKILKSTNFTNGARYADYNSSTDKLAEYGIGGLIAGGILAKTGFFAKIGIFLLKIIKPLIIGVIALFAFLGKKFFKKKEVVTEGSEQE